MELLSSYKLDNSLLDFFIYLLETESDERLWDLWVSSDKTLSFDDFKNKIVKNKSNVRMTVEEEQEALEKAENILKLNNFRELEG